MASKAWTQLMVVWKDPVWSKVIAVALVALATSVWLRVSGYSMDDVLGTLNYRVPLYVPLALVAAYFLVRLVLTITRTSQDPIWNEQVGNYTFKELYTILQNLYLPLSGKRDTDEPSPKDPKMTLALLFYSYGTRLAQGTTVDGIPGDPLYDYTALCPKLLVYGLVTKFPGTDRSKDIYRTSEVGLKFYALLEKRLLSTT